jgi:tetratricopeptide (TPR) repeat protein
MERLLSEIERLIWLGECKKVSILLSSVFSKPKPLTQSLDFLYNLSKSLLSKSFHKEAESLLSSLKTYSLANSEIFLLTDIKNLLSYCYRLSRRYEEAITEVKGAIEICRSKNELNNRLPILYLNLSAIYREDLKNLHQAKRFAILAYEVSEELIKSDLYDSLYNRHLAVSILVLGKIEEGLKNKEAAVIWYSRGIEMDHIDVEMLNQFKSRLYGVSFGFQKKSSRDGVSRQSFSVSARRRVSSRVYSRRECESLNSSQTISTQISAKQPKRKVSSP